MYAPNFDEPVVVGRGHCESRTLLESLNLVTSSGNVLSLPEHGHLGVEAANWT